MSQKKVLEKKYWTRNVLWDEKYNVTPSWRKIPMVLCKCDCWVEKYVQRSHLLSWASKNCWCLKPERAAEIWRTTWVIHRMDWTHPYRKYSSAKARCENPSNDSYYRYWWRWIKMEWETFEDFWRDMKDSYYEHVEKYWKDNTTLDRIDVNWNYCSGNCRWATREVQRNNMSTNHDVTYKWKHYPSISMLCKELGVKRRLIVDRLRYWWSVEDAVDLPLCKNNHEREKGNKVQSPPHNTD